MKNQIMPSMIRMEQELFDKLVAEVKETVATGMMMSKPNKKSFGIVGLWNIEKKRRYSGEYLRKR
jgi:hypothetical protein